MDESKTFIKEYPDAPVIETDKKNLYDGEIKMIDLMSDMPKLTAETPQPPENPKLEKFLGLQPDIGFDDHNQMALET